MGLKLEFWRWEKVMGNGQWMNALVDDIGIGIGIGIDTDTLILIPDTDTWYLIRYLDYLNTWRMEYEYGICDMGDMGDMSDMTHSHRN